MLGTLLQCLQLNLHYVKSVRIRNYSSKYFPAFGLNTERYGVSLCIQSQCEKIRTRITPNMDTFHAVLEFTSLLGTLETGLQATLNFTDLLGTAKIGLKTLTGSLIGLPGSLGILQIGLHTTLDFTCLLETLKTGSQATLRFTDLLGTLQTGLLAKSSLMKLRGTTLSVQRATKEFTDL